VKPQLLVFDLDGTLVDSFPGIRLGLNRALADVGLPVRDLTWVRRHVGRGAARLVAAAADGRCDEEELMRLFRHHYGEVVAEATPPYPGVDETLERLAHDHTLAVASNKPLHWVVELVDHLGWAPQMAAVVGPETSGAHKPDPAMIRAILETTGIGADQTLLIGDMPVDAETGANAGIPVLGVATGSCSVAELLEAGCVDVVFGVPEIPDWLHDQGD
jgi:phosphoglycolate phosphatase